MFEIFIVMLVVFSFGVLAFQLIWGYLYLNHKHLVIYRQFINKYFSRKVTRNNRKKKGGKHG